MASSTALPPTHLAKLSPHPFLLANLSQASTTPTRANHRAAHEPRPLKVNASSLSHAHGSAMVRIGDTAVICGVRGELLPVSNIPQWRTPTTALEREGMTQADKKREGAKEMRDYDLLVPNIELATGCAPQFLPGVPPSTLAQTLSTRVYSLLHNSGMLDAEDLRVWYTPPNLEGAAEDKMDDEETETTEPELKAYWTLYIDVLFISFDGNPFDAAWVAVLAALRDTKLPRAWWDADREMVLCSRGESKPLALEGLPVACTAAVLVERETEPAVRDQIKGKTWVLLDPDREEEKLCDESVTVVVDRSGGETRIREIEKVGGRALGPEEIRGVVALAEKRWADVSKELLP
ncbi:hypothetical protein N0V93_009351 [Gnomoniopsis smithogilvyi]|uniref:Ribosomal RNA-processing protein 43 n=1 Tax=Gnomoniopsis smithogilvyi TaxID=1191159 RepID=A0A9W9CSL9_9PEZI|nr:hypothetical protein N0V93_009351 [Gnomoniopsis smithogilvyi]